MLYRVRNVEGSSKDNPYPYDDWTEFWELRSGKPWPNKCSAYGCNEKAELGAHVKIVGDLSETVYIVPFCSKHNNDHDAVFTVDSSMMVRR